MGLELTTDRYPPITSQTRYPLRHAASVSYKRIMYTLGCGVNNLQLLAC